MRILIATAVILMLLGINHLIFGAGCWGYQPGGGYSMMLMITQILISAYALFVSLRWTLCKPTRYHLVFFFSAVALGLISFYLFIKIGQWMFTSVHNQGSENLIPFFAISLISVLIAIQTLLNPDNKIRLLSDCPECGYSLKNLPHRDCPECGHNSDEYALQR